MDKKISFTDQRKRLKDQKRREKATEDIKSKSTRPKLEDIFKSPPKSKSTKNNRTFKIDDSLWDTLQTLRKFNIIKSYTIFLTENLLNGIRDIELKLKHNGYDLDILKDMYYDEVSLDKYMDYLSDHKEIKGDDYNDDDRDDDPNIEEEEEDEEDD